MKKTTVKETPEQAAADFAKKYPWVKKLAIYERSAGEKIYCKLKASLLAKRGRKKEAALQLILNRRSLSLVNPAIQCFNEWRFSGKNNFLKGLNSFEKAEASKYFKDLTNVLDPHKPFGVQRALYLSNTFSKASNFLGEIAMRKKSKAVRNQIIENAAMAELLSDIRIARKIVEIESRRFKKRNN